MTRAEIALPSLKPKAPVRQCPSSSDHPRVLANWRTKPQNKLKSGPPITPETPLNPQALSKLSLVTCPLLNCGCPFATFLLAASYATRRVVLRLCDAGARFAKGVREITTADRRLASCCDEACLSFTSLCRVHLNDKYTRFFLFSYDVCPQSATPSLVIPSLPLNLVSISYFVS
jgi:hypothetical protein